jgi:hypothetical protein
MAPGSKPGWILWYSFGLVAAMDTLSENVGEGFPALHEPDVAPETDKSG